MDKKPYISLVIPAYNEEKNIKPLYELIKKSLTSSEYSYEVIFVDDGSIDDTYKVLKGIENIDSRIKVYSLRRRFGQTAAMTAGFDHALGEIIIPLDADLQNDPRDIHKLIEKINEGYDVVAGWRKHRKEPFLSRRLPSMVANYIISKVTGVNLHDTGCTLKAYKKEVIKELKLYGEMHRFMPAVAQINGARITEVVVRHHPRKFGKAKYGINRTLRVILDALTVKFLLSYQTRPMHFFGKIGTFIGGLGFLTFIYLVFERIVYITPLSSRPLFIVSIFFILIGVQFVMTGLLAEILIRVYFESQNKKTYSIKEK